MTIEQYLRGQVMWSKRTFGLASRTLDISDFSDETFGAVDHAPFDGCRSSENGFLI